MIVYHITDIENLGKILKSGVLLCDNSIIAKDISHTNIAHSDIKEKRRKKLIKVNGTAQGYVADFVPFYFCNRSPMLYTLHRRNVQGYEKDQSNIIYLCFNTDTLINGRSTWCYSDGHAVESITQFFDDTEFAQLDMRVINARYWANTAEDSDRSRRKQAEFLVFDTVDIELLESIIVHDYDVQHRVYEILSNKGFFRTVTVLHEFYY